VNVSHSGYNHNYLVQTPDCITQWTITPIWYRHVIASHSRKITTSLYKHVIVLQSEDNHNYLVQTRDCTTQ